MPTGGRTWSHRAQEFLAREAPSSSDRGQRRPSPDESWLVFTFSGSRSLAGVALPTQADGQGPLRHRRAAVRPQGAGGRALERPAQPGGQTLLWEHGPRKSPRGCVAAWPPEGSFLLSSPSAHPELPWTDCRRRPGIHSQGRRAPGRLLEEQELESQTQAAQRGVGRTAQRPRRP